MSPTTRRSLFWLPGPLVAAGLVAFAVAFNVLAGLAALCIIGAAAFLFLTPLLQLILLSTSKYRGRYGAACGAALGTTAAGLMLLTFTGLFNFT
jgi:hypothetical protein